MDGRGRGLRGFAAYRGVGERYIERRRLTRYAGVWSLWALGAGAAISGNFFGWHFGLPVGGFSGIVVATAIAAVMYLCVCFSLAEMSAAMPFTGGAYSFARTAFGPLVGYVTGLSEVVAYVLAPAAIVIGIGGYAGDALNSLLGMSVEGPIWWLVFYVAFVAINFSGAGATFRVAVVLTFLALGLLGLLWLNWALAFNWGNAMALLPGSADSQWLPTGWLGMAQALPFAIWFFMAIGQLPQAAEESRRPGVDIPRAFRWSILTLIAAAAITLLLASGLSRGWASLEEAERAAATLFGFSVNPAVPALIFVGGLAASFHALTYAYARRIHSLSRAGYLPRWLSLTRGPTRTPYLALIAGAVIGYGAALLMELGGIWTWAPVPVAAALLHMAAFGAIVACFLQMVSFVRLRRRYPGLDRRYVSPLGSGGAVVAALISLGVLVVMVFDTDYRMGLYCCGAFFAVALLYFLIMGRRRLVISPEENYALLLEEEERR